MTAHRTAAALLLLLAAALLGLLLTPRQPNPCLPGNDLTPIPITCQTDPTWSHQ